MERPVETLAMLLAGFGLGIATSIPIGPVAGLVVQLAVRHDRRAAFLCGLGCAVVDGAYSLAAALGVAEVLEAYPRIVTWMYLASGIILTTFAVRTFREARRTALLPETPAGAAPAPPLPPRRRAFFTGVAISATNPVPLIAWIGLSGTVLATVSRPAVPFFSIGVFLGVVAWFGAVTELTVRGKGLLSGHLVSVSRAIGALLVVSALLCFWRAATA
jgi:threonine/homoserine/homoserine lactone efflux protein